MNPDVQTIVSNSFKPSHFCYWHYIVKNYQKRAFYDNREAIDKKIQEIAQKIGENSFERKDVCGLTPLHVAVLTGNREGVRFLLGKGASTLIKDDFNCTPYDYAKSYHQEILALFPPVELLAPVEKEIIDIFEKWHVPIDPSPCEYKQHTQDFGVEIQEVLISGTYKRFLNEESVKKGYAIQGKLALDIVFDHMEEVLKDLGVVVKRTYYPYAARDHFLKSTNGEVKMLPQPENLEKSLDRARSLNFYFNKVGYTRSPYPFLKGFTGATSTLRDRSAQEQKEIFSKPVEMSGYMEGGNTFIVTNQKGDPQLLMGREHFYTTLNYRRMIKSDHPSFQVENFSKEKICKVAEKMYAQGILKINGSICLMDSEKIKEFFNDDAVQGLASKSVEGKGHTFLTLAIDKGLVKRFSLDESQIEECRASVTNYLMKKQIAKSYISNGLNVNPDNIQLLPQVMYHLDLFIKPGPKRSFFVQDFSMNIEIIKKLIDKAEVLNLNLDDKQLLLRYLSVSIKMNEDLSPLLKEAGCRIEQAGLKVIPMPGIFFDIPTQMNGFNFNFMNALSGWSKKTQRYYYITAGIQVGNQLGGIFMEMLTKFLKSYESNMDVIFIGSPKENRKDFSKAMLLWNDGQILAGPHCYSFETKTASHEG